MDPYPAIAHETTPNGAPAAGFSGVTFKLLGPLEVLKDDRDCAPTAPKVLQLLGMLLLQAGTAVHSDAIIEELWAGAPPRSMRTTMQTYVYQLRKSFEANRLTPDAESLLITKPPGYLLRVRPEQVDVVVFQQLRQRGRDLMRQGAYAEAAHTFRTALSLWTGSPLANVQCGPVLAAYAIELQEQWRTVQHLRLQAELESGMHRDVIGELRHLVSDNPFDEGLHALLMKALSASGRRSDALAAYRTLRAVLIEEMGVEPCAELQRIHTELLTAA
jgi:DNA-binding SARP family transcriptional activator